MDLTEDARRRLDAALDGALAARPLDPARRAHVRNELSRAVLAEAERKALAWGQGVITANHVDAALATPGGIDALAAPFLRRAEPERAGFWLRTGAYLLDIIILGIAGSVLFLPVQILLALAGAPEGWDADAPFFPFAPFDDAPARGAEFAFLALMSLATAALHLAYFTYMESTRGQTFGKMMLGLRAVREDGASMGLNEALVRNLPKLNTALILLDGLIMGIFRGMRKRRLADTLAGTLVVREPSP